MPNSSEHTSVMLGETLANLINNPNGNYIDATFGRGGHSKAILAELNNSGNLLGIDKDPEAIETAKRLKKKDNRFNFKQGSFKDIKQFAKELNLLPIDGILFDLGVSSPQLDNPERGFSFMKDGPLDMRMDPDSGQSAAEWINSVSEQNLADVLYQYGDERYSRRIAKFIVKARDEKNIETTLELAEIIKLAHPKWDKHKHPATRSFQAIRIFINQELSDLEMALKDAVDCLKPNGRLVVISFHSLEDRIVKNFISGGNTPQLPKEIPIPYSQNKGLLRRVGKALRPSAEEITKNARARSAVCRTAEKVL